MASPRLPLADDLFLTAHDSVRNRSLLSPTTLGIGLGTALIAELFFWGNVELQNGILSIVDRRPPNNAAAAAVFDQMLRDPDHPKARDWIAFLARGVAADLVERRLSRAGLVERQERRGLLGKRVTFVPRDSTTAGWPGARIVAAAQRGELLDVADLILAGLILATGLDQHVLATLEPRHRENLFEQLRRRLPAMGRELVGHAEAAVGDAVMTGRA
jgi:hypothetical protein